MNKKHKVRNIARATRRGEDVAIDGVGQGYQLVVVPPLLSIISQDICSRV